MPFENQFALINQLGGRNGCFVSPGGCSDFTSTDRNHRARCFVPPSPASGAHAPGRAPPTEPRAMRDTASVLYTNGARGFDSKQSPTAPRAMMREAKAQSCAARMRQVPIESPFMASSGMMGDQYAGERTLANSRFGEVHNAHNRSVHCGQRPVYAHAWFRNLVTFDEMPRYSKRGGGKCKGKGKGKGKGNSRGEAQSPVLQSVPIFLDLNVQPAAFHDQRIRQLQGRGRGMPSTSSQHGVDFTGTSSVEAAGPAREEPRTTYGRPTPVSSTIELDEQELHDGIYPRGLPSDKFPSLRGELEDLLDLRDEETMLPSPQTPEEQIAYEVLRDRREWCLPAIVDVAEELKQLGHNDGDGERRVRWAVAEVIKRREIYLYMVRTRGIDKDAMDAMDEARAWHQYVLANVEIEQAEDQPASRVVRETPSSEVAALRARMLRKREEHATIRNKRLNRESPAQKEEIDDFVHIGMADVASEADHGVLLDPADIEDESDGDWCLIGSCRSTTSESGDVSSS